MSRPGRTLFANVSVTLAAGDRLGVVGINGTGKSTLLRVLAGGEEPESGTIRWRRDITIAVLDQEAKIPSGTVRAAVGEGWRGEAVLDRLGLGQLLDAEIDSLSGGQEKRVALAKALVAESDLLILDEPTNHLDVDTIEWLEHELARYKGGLILVTHDRHLLDRVASRILELDRGKAFGHEGGYGGYLAGRAAREARAEAAESTRCNLARRELAWLRRGAPARTRKSKSRIASATAMVEGRAEAAARDGQLDLTAFRSQIPRLGDQVVELHGASIGFPGTAPLVAGLDLLIDRRERLGIVGANGTGKSTMLDVIAGLRSPTAGSMVTGPTARIGYHDQRGRELDPAMRARDAVAGDDSEPTWWHSALMERFWFDADAQWAPIELLSGGERRRLQLVLTLAQAPNVLLLDEPTNDLDLDTLRALEGLLDEWPGAVVVASHDRTFLDRTVDDVIVLDGSGRARRWPGGYAGWLESRQPASERTLAQPSPSSSSGRPESKSNLSSESSRSASTIRHEQKEAARLVARLQRDVEELRATVAQVADDHVALARSGRQLAEVETELANAEERWLEFSVELDDR